MPINEEKQASSLIVDLEQLSEAVIQNKFGARHEVIRGVAPEKYITILVVETNEMIAGAGYSLIEDTLKNQFGVSAMQTVFGAKVPTARSKNQRFDIHITGHLRVEELGNGE